MPPSLFLPALPCPRYGTLGHFIEFSGPPSREVTGEALCVGVRLIPTTSRGTLQDQKAEDMRRLQTVV